MSTERAVPASPGATYELKVLIFLTPGGHGGVRFLDRQSTTDIARVSKRSVDAPLLNGGANRCRSHAFFNALPALLHSVNLRGITRFDSVILVPGAFGHAALFGSRWLSQVAPGCASGSGRISSGVLP